jgi:hypothetical protein
MVLLTKWRRMVALSLGIFLKGHGSSMVRGYKSLAFWFFFGEFYLLLIYGVLGYCFHIRVFFLILIWCCIQLLAYVICIVVVNNFLCRLTISLRFIGGNCWVLREAVVNLHLQPIAFYSWKLHLLPITHGGLNALLIFQ